MQISNSTTVHVRRPGNPKKWRARLLCEGIICDLALLTVDEEEFWSEDLMSLQFVDVPELQVHAVLLIPSRSCRVPLNHGVVRACKASMPRASCHTCISGANSAPCGICMREQQE